MFPEGWPGETQELKLDISLVHTGFLSGVRRVHRSSLPGSPVHTSSLALGGAAASSCPPPASVSIPGHQGHTVWLGC